MIRFCKDQTMYDSWIKMSETGIQREHVILNETIWHRARDFFKRSKGENLLPVLDKEFRLLCFAWQDEEANRELRMLRELETNRNALSFCDLFPDYKAVTIHGCNELAWCFAEYLIRAGVAVNVEGEIWQVLGKQNKCAVPVCQNYEIWAEGVHRKSGNWKEERLRSVSVEFECIDQIYESNIKAEIIKDADSGLGGLLRRLRKEREIVVRGTGTKAQDAYDWLLMNGIEINAFQSDQPQKGRKSLFGKPILKKTEVRERFREAVTIECGTKHSAWGFGDVDIYDYEGYERNKRYFLLRDYIEVPQNNLRHILGGRSLILIGDFRLCNRFYRWWIRQGGEAEEIGYWDILEQNSEEIDQLQIPEISGKGQTESRIYVLVGVKHSSNIGITKEAAEQFGLYIDKLMKLGVNDYTDYFSDMEKAIYLDTEVIKYAKNDLRPAGILVGAIPAHCGNVLFRQSLAGHPQIIMIEEYGFFNNDLYSICIRLAEERSDNILSYFWEIIHEALTEDVIIFCFPDGERFDHEMSRMLRMFDNLTSQELFVMFHLAYAVMHGRKVDLNNTIIYWEPHMWDHRLVREFAHWLSDKSVKGFTVRLVRNRYILAGSCIKDLVSKSEWKTGAVMFGGIYLDNGKEYENWSECTIKFEDLKCNPEEILTTLCKWLGISFCKTLMETTFHGETAYYEGIVTGFDVKPAYNLYEEFFSGFDRMRICIAAASYQKFYGYPYVSCTDFSRRELQEMFLKDFRWEMLPDADRGKDEESIWNMQKRIRHLCWLERFAEVMNIELVEGY